MTDLPHDAMGDWLSGRKVDPAGPEAPTVHLLADLLAHPELLQPPKVILPEIAYRGRITLLAAPRKAGKSTMLGAAVSAATRGRLILGKSGEKGSVLWCALDEPLNDVVRRFQTEGADPSLVYVLVPLATVLAIATAAARLGVAVVVIDAISDLAAREIGDENDALSVKRLLSPLRDLARTRDIAVVLLHHTNKAARKSRGSGVFEEMADLILTLTIDKDPTVRKVTAEGRVGVESYRLRWTPDGLELADHEASTVELVRSLIRLTPGCSARSLRGKVGKRYEEVQRALASLRAQGAIENRGDQGASEWYVIEGGNRPGTVQ